MKKWLATQIAQNISTPPRSLRDALHLMGLHQRTLTLHGVLVDDRSTEDEICFVDSASSYLLIPRRDIVSISEIGEGVVEARLLDRGELWRSTKMPTAEILIRDQINYSIVREDEENIPPAVSFRAFGDPDPGQPTHQEKLSAGVTIEGAAKVFERRCKGGGEYKNNCAHFLSNAFRNAGFTDFDVSHECVNARCNTNTDEQITPCSFAGHFDYRPIRAKELRCWFSRKATTVKDEISKGSGFWATYQERPSDAQGHVAIIDSNNWIYYGTGWYSKAQGWRQEYYKW